MLPFKSRDEAISALEEGKADAFASDRLLLVGAATKARPNTLTLLADQLSLEPYGIVVRRAATPAALVATSGLARIFAGDEIVEIYSPLVRAVRSPHDPAGGGVRARRHT